MKLAIAYSTKDRVELTRQSIARLNGIHAHIFWNDGSVTESGHTLQHTLPFDAIRPVPFCARVTGGADAAIVFALTQMLKDPSYTHVGLLENDVLLSPNWFESTMALFEAGERDGLVVGAVSARTYEDRILIQRPDYAIMHNLGAGHIVFTSQAAQLVLDFYRTGWWNDNRKVFSTLSGIDIGHYACFRGADTHTTGDWHWDAILAQRGLASLGCTPSHVEMIGQDPPLEEQGLRIARAPVADRINDPAFEMFRHHTRCIRDGKMRLDVIQRPLRTQGTYTYFAHQLPRIGGKFNDGWHLKWCQGFGPFSYTSAGHGKLTIPLFGPASLVVSGGKSGAIVKVLDRKSGFEANPSLPAEGENVTAMNLNIPGSMAYREIEVEINEGGRLFAIQTSDAQPEFPNIRFDYESLPPVRD